MKKEVFTPKGMKVFGGPVLRQPLQEDLHLFRDRSP